MMPLAKTIWITQKSQLGKKQKKKKKTEKHINNQLDFHECYYISTQKERYQNNHPVVIANKGHSQ